MGILSVTVKYIDSFKVEQLCVSLTGQYYRMEKIKEDLLRALECPVCLCLMQAPIIMCSNGHSICETCKVKLENCPTCRSGFVNIRNKLAEDLSSSIVHPCKYQEAGCTKRFVFGQDEEHEKECRYGPHKCPYYIVDRVRCKWEGPGTQLEQHIRNEHNNMGQVTVTAGKLPRVFSTFRNGERAIAVFTLDSIFLSYSKMIDTIFYQCCMFVGAREDINNYKYTVSIKTTDGKHSVTATIPCPHYQEFIGGNFPNGKCAVFHKDFTKLCVIEDGKLPFEFEIQLN